MTPGRRGAPAAVSDRGIAGRHPGAPVLLEGRDSALRDAYEVVARAEPEASAVEPGTPSTPADGQREDAKADRARPKYRAWADLMRRAFEADVLACPRCGGRMSVLATIEDPAVIQRILTHLGLSMEAGACQGDRAQPLLR